MMARTTPYKHDCECFDDINEHMLIPGITGIVQEYLHSMDAPYIRSVLKPPISLRYASADDYLFTFSEKVMSGRIVWPYSSNAYVLIDLEIDPDRTYRILSPAKCTIEMSISFTPPICSLAQFAGDANKKMKFRTLLTGNKIGDEINRILSRDWREVLILEINKRERFIQERFIRELISTDIFDAACEMFRRKIIRTIYSKYHVDQQEEADALLGYHYDITCM